MGHKMINKNLFREIAKQVHPDLNGNGAGFNAKMQEVNKFKNNPEILLRLAKQWGLNLNGSFDDIKFDRKASDYKERVYHCVVGAIIRHSYKYKFKNKSVRGVITKIRTIKKGKYVGAFEFTVYNFIDNSLFKLKTRNLEPFIVVGMAHDDDLQLGWKAEEDIKEHKKEMSNYKRYLSLPVFSKLGIDTNTSYINSNTSVMINYKGGPKWKRLVRTTEKSVFIWETERDRLNNKQRRISIKHIMKLNYNTLVNP
uniref:Uncharacterized protein n=1 Tax=viral metagenome TaxID=1070528 RepID=A0A6M3JXS2_9ZZZZ